MNAVLVTLHVFVCVFLIAVVLLQRGKGAEIGAVFGSGASSTVFGSRGAGNFLTKLTTGSAIVFMLTSLTLSYLATTQREQRLFEEGAAEEQQPAGEESFFPEPVQDALEGKSAGSAPEAATAPQSPAAAPAEAADTQAPVAGGAGGGAPDAASPSEPDRPSDPR